MMRRVPTPVIAVAVLLIGTSCGSADVLPTTGPSSQTLDEFMGWADFDQAAADRAHADLMARVGEMTVECMADHGLDYTPWIPPDALDLDELPPAESLLLYGYGVFALMLEQYRFEMGHPDEIGNPNEAIHAQNAPEGVDYMTVMWGCEDDAESALIGGSPELPLLVDEAWSPLNDELDAVHQELERDPRLAEAEMVWSACMAERGYDFASEGDVEAYLGERFGEFDELGGSPALWEGVLTEADLQPFADEEMAIAEADASCRGEFDEVREELRRAYESRFIDEHLEELEQIRPIEERLMDQLLAGIRW
jgi:hypothetical protein